MRVLFCASSFAFDVLVDARTRQQHDVVNVDVGCNFFESAKGSNERGFICSQEGGLLAASTERRVCCGVYRGRH
jgi:hypothetical protein